MPIIATSTHPVSHASDARAGKYLTFQLGREEYGIGVLHVREIMGLQDITSVPHTPPHVRGVINLRGKVIPVLCLRSRFQMALAEDTARTAIIVVQLQGAAGPMQVGVIVDSVSEVLNVNAADIENTPDFGNGMTTESLLGLAKIKDTVKLLLNIDIILRGAGLNDLSLA
jgi:purine-binding chemotaxis protein CheW